MCMNCTRPLSQHEVALSCTSIASHELFVSITAKCIGKSTTTKGLKLGTMLSSCAFRPITQTRLSSASKLLRTSQYKMDIMTAPKWHKPSRSAIKGIFHHASKDAQSDEMCEQARGTKVNQAQDTEQAKPKYHALVRTYQATEGSQKVRQGIT